MILHGILEDNELSCLPLPPPFFSVKWEKQSFRGIGTSESSVHVNCSYLLSVLGGCRMVPQGHWTQALGLWSRSAHQFWIYSFQGLSKASKLVPWCCERSNLQPWGCTGGTVWVGGSTLRFVSGKQQLQKGFIDSVVYIGDKFHSYVKGGRKVEFHSILLT